MMFTPKGISCRFLCGGHGMVKQGDFVKILHEEFLELLGEVLRVNNNGRYSVLVKIFDPQYFNGKTIKKTERFFTKNQVEVIDVSQFQRVNSFIQED